MVFETEIGAASDVFLVEAVVCLGFLRAFFGGSKGWSKRPFTRGLELSLSLSLSSIGWELRC